MACHHQAARTPSSDSPRQRTLQHWRKKFNCWGWRKKGSKRNSGSTNCQPKVSKIGYRWFRQVPITSRKKDRCWLLRMTWDSWRAGIRSTPRPCTISPLLLASRRLLKNSLTGSEKINVISIFEVLRLLFKALMKWKNRRIILLYC